VEVALADDVAASSCGGSASQVSIDGFSVARFKRQIAGEAKQIGAGAVVWKLLKNRGDPANSVAGGVSVGAQEGVAPKQAKRRLGVVDAVQKGFVDDCAGRRRVGGDIE